MRQPSAGRTSVPKLDQPIVEPLMIPLDVVGKPKDSIPAIGLENRSERQAALLSVSSHCSKNNSGERPLSDPWGRSVLYS